MPRSLALNDTKPSYDILMLAPTGFFSDYGCHVRILEEASVLQKRGHRPVICTYHRGRDVPGLKIIRIPNVPWGRDYGMGSSWHRLVFDAFLFARSLAVCHRTPPHLIHAFLHEGAWIGSVLSRIWNVPMVFDYQGSLTGEMIDHGFIRRGTFLHELLRRVENRINNSPHAIVTSSVHAARLLRDDLGCRCDVIRTIPDCVDTDCFRPLSPNETLALRHKLGLPTPGLIVAYLGKLAGYQGTDLLLEAAALLCSRRRDLHFLVMGYPQVRKYRERAGELGLAGRITFTGRVPYEQAAQYLAVADIAVAPKLSETESNGKLLNYMAMGLPTVTFDTPVAREYLENLGHYASPQDALSLAAAIEKVVVQGCRMEPLRKQLRQRAQLFYSWDQAGERLEHVYQHVLQNALKNKAIPSFSGKVEI